MFCKTLILLAVGIVVHVKILYGAPTSKKLRLPVLSRLCEPPKSRCYYQPEDTCFRDNECRSNKFYKGICCPHECHPYKVCQYIQKTATTERIPTTQRTLATTDGSTVTEESGATDGPIITEEYVITQKPSTTNVPSTNYTTQVPKTTSMPDTSAQKPTTTQVATTKKETTQKPTTAQVPTTSTTTLALPTTILPISTLLPRTTKMSTTEHIPTNTKAPTPKPTPDIRCRSNERKNILFVVDGTRNFRQYLDTIKQEFGMLKSYLKKAISRLENQNFMIGVMQFGGRRAPKMEVSFTKGTEMPRLLSRVDAIKQAKGSVRKYGEALEAASNEFYKVKYLYDRYYSQDIIVFITRGYDFDKVKTKREVEMLKIKSIKIISVGIGSSRPNYLEKHLYHVLDSSFKNVHIAKYKNLGSIENSVVNGICSTFAKAGTFSVCGRQRNDIYFVLDGSASIDHSNFNKKRDFLIDLLYLLETPKSDLHIGMMQFSEVSKTRELLELGKHTIEEEEKLLRGMLYDHGIKTMLGDALDRFNKAIFNGNGGDRSDAKDILIIFSDGRAHDLTEALRQAEIIKKKGVRIITLTVLRNAMTNALTQMASEPKYSIEVNLRDPTYYAQKLASLICPSYKKRKL